MRMLIRPYITGRDADMGATTCAETDNNATTITCDVTHAIADASNTA